MKTKTTDEKIKELFDLVQKKKLEIEKAERPIWETSRNFGFSPNSAHDRISIPTITDTRKIVEMYAFLLERKDKVEKSAEELNVKYDFTWLGFTVEEWKSDFSTRINQITIQEKRKNLLEHEVRLSAILSPEMIKEMEINSMTESLKHI